KVIHKFDTPTVVEFRRAQDTRDELEDISRVVGLKPQEHKELQKWLEERVAAARRAWLEDGVDVSLEDAVRAMLERDGKPANFSQWALLLRGGIPDQLRNQRFDDFLLDEASGLLRRFFPELYESQRVLEQLSQR
ncbi:hypothetical protein LCGC14_2882690, partial [marine sediment metagenome]